MTKKINLRGIKHDGFHLQKLSFCAFNHIFQKTIFKKKFKKNVLDITRVLFKDASTTIDIVPQLKLLLGCHTFRKK